MPTVKGNYLSSIEQPLGMRMRSDLVCMRQHFCGCQYWVIKDPFALKYHRLVNEQFAILEMVDGRRSLLDIHREFNARFAPTDITPKGILNAIANLHESGLVASSLPGQGEQLLLRRRRTARQKRINSLSNILAIQLPGFDPTWLLARLYPIAYLFFIPIGVFICMAIVLAALTLVAIKFDTFQGRLPTFHEFFGPQNWMLFAGVIAFTKIVHELGHGIACRKFGGECHSMGIMLLVFTPCLYCDVSDSWMVRSKWQRAAIGAAGMYVEVVLAGLATFVWWFSSPGYVNHVALQIMFISSVSTILFNGNPLLRMDGYYILSDIMEIPNLRQSAQSSLQRLLSRLCLGLDVPPDPFLPIGNTVLFAVYAVTSFIYRWIIVFAILWFLCKVLEPYDLKVIGQSLAVISLSMMVSNLLRAGFKIVKVPGRMEQIKRRNLIITVVGLFVLASLATLVPVPRYVNCPFELKTKDSAVVYVTVPGRLEEVLVTQGQPVVVGQILARMRNLHLEMEIAELKGRAAQYGSQVNSVRRQRFNNPEAGERLASIEEELKSVVEQLDAKRRSLAQLTLRAPYSGTVLPGVMDHPQPGQDTLRRWQGHLLDPENRGAMAQIGEPFCQIGSTETLEAELVVDQSDLDVVHPGQEVKLKIDAMPMATFSSKVTEISKRKLQQAPPNLMYQHGGSVATRTDQAGVAEPLNSSYLARVPINQPLPKFQIGLRGVARIYTGDETLFAKFVRYAVRTFRFEL